MNEAYLHFIWKLKRLPFHLFHTTDGKPIHINSPGIHNLSESGPDFSNARMQYENMEWAGQIELHVKSSDWYKHGHQNDPAYNNVILHVVYEHDQEVEVNHSNLPTIELKPWIDEAHYQQWQQFAASVKDFACEDSIHTIDAIYLKTMMHRAIHDRLTRKANLILFQYGHLDQPSLLYLFIARAFGTKVNSIPFEWITNTLPLSLLKRLHRTHQKELILKTSGLYPTVSDNEIVPSLPPSIWKRKGLRPGSFPEKRIHQFAIFMSSCDIELLASYHTPEEVSSYLHQFVTQYNQTADHPISNSFFEQLFINAFIPYLWLRSLKEEREELQTFVLDFLSTLKVENNYLIDKWKRMKIHPKNAYESQALIEIYNELCTLKKCLSCQVGIAILKNDNSKIKKD